MIKKVRAVRNYMGIGEWGDERDLLVSNGHPRGTALLDDATHGDGVPHQDSVAQAAQTKDGGRNDLTKTGQEPETVQIRGVNVRT
jgi:hypothetical protein